MKVLVTGSNGMLGQDLCPVLEDEGYEVIETTRNSMDITDLERVERVINTHAPELVIHTAAYTDVEKAEVEREEAHSVNVAGTRNIVQVCKKQDIPLVYISSDYVFDGEKDSPYKPEDRPNPVNYYGQTKLDGEEAVKELSKYYIIRTSWLYGHHGNNFVTKLLLQDFSKEIKIVDDQIGSPTWTVDLATGIVNIIGKGEKYGIYHVCNSGAVSRFEFAEEIFAVFDLKANIVPCKTSDIQSNVKRPKYSVLDNQGHYRNWEVAFSDFAALADF